MCAYAVAKKAAIIFRISVSLFEVSSKPGVSMRITLLPSRMNSSASWTSAVHDSKFIPIRRFERLARLMNWGGRRVSFLVIIEGSSSTHRCFTTPGCTHDSVTAVRMTFRQAIGYIRDHDGWAKSLPMLTRPSTLPRRWGTAKKSDHYIETKPMRISDPEL